MSKKTMSIDRILSQISSLKDNSKSFFTNDGDDRIWREDVKACHIVIAILSALQDAGFNKPEQIYNLAKQSKQERIRCALITTWVDVDSGEDQTLECRGVYKDPEKAYGAALLYLDEMAENDRGEDDGELMITTTVRLEGETGFGLFLKNKDGKDLYRTYILDVPEQEGSETDGGD